MKQRLVEAPPLIAILAVLALLAAADGAFARSQSSIRIIALDAEPAGNTATSLARLDSCTRAELGSEVIVDLVVDSVPEDRPFLGFQVAVDYDPDILTVIAMDNAYLLGANGAFEPFEGLSDPLPDTDGSFTIMIADLASVPPNENMESGPGVLTRLTFSARRTGTSVLTPGFDPPDVYPALVDATNSVIEVRTIVGIRVAVGEDCPRGRHGLRQVLHLAP